MADIGLTQEQIDQVLGSAESSAAGLDVAALADFERETMGNLPSVLNALTGFDYQLEAVEFATTAPDELAELIGSDLCFKIPITVSDAMVHCLILDNQFAKVVASALTGGEVTEDTELNEMEMSAIVEVISQANGSYLTSLSSALAISATGDAVEQGEASSIGAEIGEGAILGTISLKQAEQDTTTIRHLIPKALVDRIMAKIGETTAPAEEPAPVPEPVSPAPPPEVEPMAVASAPQPASVPAGVPSGNVAGPTTQYQPASFSQLLQPKSEAEIRNLDILLDVPLQITVELGKTQIPIKQILEYGQGSLITLDKLAGEPIDLLVNGKYFAKGEVVVIDENFGVRITSILSPAERLAQLS